MPNSRRAGLARIIKRFKYDSSEFHCYRINVMERWPNGPEENDRAGSRREPKQAVPVITLGQVVRRLVLPGTQADPDTLIVELTNPKAERQP